MNRPNLLLAVLAAATMDNVVLDRSDGLTPVNARQGVRRAQEAPPVACSRPQQIIEVWADAGSTSEAETRELLEGLRILARIAERAYLRQEVSLPHP